MKLADSYNNVRGNDCLMACVTAYMKYCGLRINESDIFLAGDGYHIAYLGNIYDPKIGADAYEAVYRFIKKYKIPHVHGKIRGEDAVCCLEEAADKGQMISVRVMTSGLTYDNVYKSIKAPHWISVIGRNNDKYTIADNAIPGMAGKVYKGDIDKGELILAWKEMDYEYFILKGAVKNISGIETVIKEDAKKELDKGLKRYFNPKRHVFTSEKEGIHAVRGLLEDFKSLDAADRNEALAIVQMVHYRARIGGIVSYKNIIYEKLCELGFSVKLIKEYKDNILVWNKVFMKLLKTGIRCDETQIDKVIDMAEEAARKEKKIYESYLQWRHLV